MPDLTHLHALELHLSNERIRLGAAKSAYEQALRAVWIQQLEREIAGERTFLGLGLSGQPGLDDDSLLSELLG